MGTSFRAAAPLVLACALALAACDRRIERFDPAEEPSQPDLSRIFPPGAQRSPLEPGLPPAPGAPAPPAPAGARRAQGGPAGGAGGEPIQGSVSLAAGLEGRVPLGATLFLIARRGDAGPPLAVKRIAQPRFPLEFTLGPEDRMLEAVPFEGPLRLSARLDGDGNATTREAGDLQGAAPGPLSPGARGVHVVLDQAL
jgi:cytochrome c-type biogenesis protein CcmH